MWKFDSAGRGGNALALLERMQKEELLQINDAAYVFWPEGKKKPKTEQLHNLTGAGALGGSFWGLLFGLIFFVPLLGMAVGAAMGALAGSMTDVGIDDEFISEVREQVTPGTSALFVMTSNVVVDKVLDEFKETGADPDLDQPVQRAGGASCGRPSPRPSGPRGPATGGSGPDPARSPCGPAHPRGGCAPRLVGEGRVTLRGGHATRRPHRAVRSRAISD